MKIKFGIPHIKKKNNTFNDYDDPELEIKKGDLICQKDSNTFENHKI